MKRKKHFLVAMCMFFLLTGCGNLGRQGDVQTEQLSAVSEYSIYRYMPETGEWILMGMG